MHQGLDFGPQGQGQGQAYHLQGQSLVLQGQGQAKNFGLKPRQRLNITAMITATIPRILSTTFNRLSEECRKLCSQELAVTSNTHMVCLDIDQI